MGKVKYHIKMIVGNMCIGSSREKRREDFGLSKMVKIRIFTLISVKAGLL